MTGPCTPAELVRKQSGKRFRVLQRHTGALPARRLKRMRGVSEQYTPIFPPRRKWRRGECWPDPVDFCVRDDALNHTILLAPMPFSEPVLRLLDIDLAPVLGQLGVGVW